MAKCGLAIEFDRERPLNLPRVMDGLEKQIITSALEEAGGVKTTAAKMVGINRTTFVEKMRKHDLPLNPPPYRR